ncbi:MAG TPA: hypothetical protein VID69_01940 [Actinomycetota bacterium]|jgi:hypothetical protein
MEDEATISRWEDVGARIAVAAGVLAAIAVLWPKGKKSSVVARPKDPSHKIVCSCDCARREGNVITSWEETFDTPAEGCASLNGVTCNHPNGKQGKLGNCSKKSVPVSRADVVGPEDVITVKS